MLLLLAQFAYYAMWVPIKNAKWSKFSKLSPTVSLFFSTPFHSIPFPQTLSVLPLRVVEAASFPLLIQPPTSPLPANFSWKWAAGCDREPIKLVKVTCFWSSYCACTGLVETKLNLRIGIVKNDMTGTQHESCYVIVWQPYLCTKENETGNWHFCCLLVYTYIREVQGPSVIAVFHSNPSVLLRTCTLIRAHKNMNAATAVKTRYEINFFSWATLGM